MKKVIVSMVIAMVAIVGIPSITQAQGTGAYATFRVNGNTTNTHNEYLNAGHVHITISGDGDTDLDLYVYDSYGNRVFTGEGNNDDEAACFRVNWAGNFRIRVVNRGKVYNNYKMSLEYK